MNAIFEMPAALQGKKITPIVGTIDLDIKFDLWRDYTDWLDPDLRSTHWHDLDVLNHVQVCVEVSMSNTVLDRKILGNFETVSLHTEFDDTISGSQDLIVRISNLNKLPVRSDANLFVSGMIQIQSLRLQGLEIAHLLENTMFGRDAVTQLNLETPVYPWMIKNRKRILPTFFNFPMADI